MSFRPVTKDRNGIYYLNICSILVPIILFNIIMMKYAKEEGVAAFTAINYILWLGNMVNYAAADSLNPLISTNYGAGKFNRIKNFLITGLIFTISNGIFIFFTGLYALAKMVDGMNNKYINSKDKVVNLIEIVVSVILTFIIFKI